MWWLWLVTIIIILVAVLPQFSEGRLRFHSLSLGGAALFLWSFLFLPWVSLSLRCLLQTFTGDLSPLLDAAGLTVEALLRMSGSPDLQALQEGASLIAYYIANPSGILLLFKLPGTEPNYLLWAGLLVPAFYALLALIAAVIAFIPAFHRLQKAVGVLVSLLGLLIIFPLLLVALPEIDAGHLRPVLTRSGCLDPGRKSGPGRLDRAAGGPADDDCRWRTPVCRGRGI